MNRPAKAPPISTGYTDHLNEYDAASLSKCLFTFRTLCHLNKIFVIWDYANGKPVVRGALEVLNMIADARNGAQCHVETYLDGVLGSAQLSHYIKPLFGGRIFCHIPTHFNFHCESLDDKKVVRYPVVFQTEGTPHKKTEGKLRVTQLGEFRAMFPEFKDLKV